MNEKKIISIVLVTCDRPELFQRALESCANQTDQRFELIVVDDGSSPLPINSVVHRGIITKYKRTGGHKGAPYARNLGVHLARTQWITFLDDDDYLRETRIETLASYITNNKIEGYEFLGTTTINRIGNENKKFKNDDRGTYQLSDFLRGCIVGISVLLKKETFIAAGGFDESLTGSQDWELWIRLLSGGGKMLKIDTFDYVVTSDSDRRITTSPRRALAYKTIIEKHNHLMTPKNVNYFQCLSRFSESKTISIYEVILECLRHQTIFPIKVQLKIYHQKLREFLQ